MLRQYTKRFHKIIEKTASVAEKVHKNVASLPLEFIENASEGSPNEETKASIDNIKRMQDKTIGAIYKVVRSVNDQVGEIADGVIDEVEQSSVIPPEPDPEAATLKADADCLKEEIAALKVQKAANSKLKAEKAELEAEKALLEAELKAEEADA